jgi:hypothetical protein
MKNRVVISESELVNLINKVINEAETADCKCCKAGVRPSPTHAPPIIVYAEKQRHLECCKKCKDEGGMVSSDGRRREFNEYDNPFENPGSGSGPNWLTQQANWANYDGTPATAPLPPTAFLNRMSTMGCVKKNSRLNHLINKWSNTAGVQGTGFAAPQGTIHPDNPRWQSILASKIIWLMDDVNNNC